MRGLCAALALTSITLVSVAVPVVASPKCASLLHQHETYNDYDFCPDSMLGAAPVHEGSFANCPSFPQRRCVSHTPQFFKVAPNTTAFRHSPPSSNVFRSASTPYPEFSELAARASGDCMSCWQFASERVRWSAFINMVENTIGFKFLNSPVRTVLDFGAGSGGFLSGMLDRGVIGIGFARNWGNLPYLETAAARGALIMHMDFRRHVPMASGAVDMVHCSWAMNLLSMREEIEAVLMEWDRLVRPGGYIVQHGFRAKDNETFRILSHVVERVARLLQWEMLRWSDNTRGESAAYLTFIARKPLKRDTLDVAAMEVDLAADPEGQLQTLI